VTTAQYTKLFNNFNAELKTEYTNLSNISNAELSDYRKTNRSAH